jgi:tetratricopeptide (TPR) repeat protein
LGSFTPSLRWAFLPTWLLLALGAACLAVLPFDRRLLIGAGAIGLYSATIVAFFAGERLRAPLLLLALPYAGASLVQLVAATPGRRRTLIARAGAVVLAFALTAHLPLLGANELAGPYNMHALILFSQGDQAGAERWYRRSLALQQLDSPGARIGLAAILQRRGRVGDAVALLEPLPDTHYEAASKHEWLGNLALGQRRIDDAITAYQAALAIDSSRQNAYKGLYIAHRMRGDTSLAAATDDRLHYVMSFE